MEGAARQRGETLLDECFAAVHEAGLLGSVRETALGHVGQIGFVVLADVSGVGIGDSAVFAHPRHRDGGVQAAGECDADALTDGKFVQYLGHASMVSVYSVSSKTAPARIDPLT